jgi:sec-independent protein translocase protein TatB
MNFLGIGPGELFLIIILTLVVVGPERLPSVARQAGRMLVRARNWLQTSPDAALVLRARQEIEHELVQIRSSLLEVQTVRDEVIGAVKQLDEAVSPLTHVRPPSLSDIIKPPAEQTYSAGDAGQIAPATDSVPVEAVAEAAPIDGDAVVEAAPIDDAAVDLAPEAAPVMELAPELAASDARQNGTTSAQAAQNGVDRPPTAAEIEALGLRIQAIMADLFALQEQLKQRGLLADDWQPPSHAMQLPSDAHTEEAGG